MFKFYRKEDAAYAAMLPKIAITDGINFDEIPPIGAESYPVYLPEEGYGFLHEAAIIEFHGKLFASWYNNPAHELQGYTPIRGCESTDGGKTWSPAHTLAEDKSGKILYCPPVYGVDGDTLYMFMNQMVSADHMHALDLYIYKEDSDTFERLWSRPIPFKLNTNVYRLNNGKLLLPGRIAKMDGFPNTPAVMISDSGRIDAAWRLVNIAPDGNLADGSKLVHPELSAVIDGDTVYIFCRDDERRVPLMYRSDDNGETWSTPIAIDIPFANSKIYSGTLSDGRNYVVGNLFCREDRPTREWLALLVSEPGEMRFTKLVTLQYRESAALGFGRDQWSYPVAHEADGKLYVIYTVCPVPGDNNTRGAVVSVVELKNI